jgi:hypothetical protein
MQRTKGFRPITGGSRLSGEALLRAVDSQLVGVPPAAVDAPASSPQSPPRPRAKPAPFVLRLAPAVFLALEQAAERDGTTMTVKIAEALKAAGYPVPESDLKDRRRRRDYAALAGEEAGGV